MYNNNFNELESKYKPLILKVIKNKFVDGYERDDLYQECLMVLQKCNSDFNEEKNTKFTTYLFTSMQNKMFDLIKTVNRVKRPVIEYTDYDDNSIINAVYEDFDKTDEVEINETYSKIINDLLKLPRGYVTYLIYVGGMSMKDVAYIEGVSDRRIQYINKSNLRKLKEMQK